MGLAASVRSGVTETFHEGAVAVCGPDGELIAGYGDIDRPFYIRSASKPFQAHISQQAGADLSPLELAVASSSHRALPAQIAMVEKMLADKGLVEDDLLCPPDWPADRRIARLVSAEGASQPRRIWHNCSGKHTGFLRACVASGWSTEDYLSATHPLQLKVADLIAEVGRFDPEPRGIDGCGAPVHRTTTRVMARMFAALVSDPMFEQVYTACRRYPAMIGGNQENDSKIAIATGGVAKGGAQGCIGVGLPSGIGLAVKSWDGLSMIAGIGAVEAFRQLNLLPPPGRASLASVANPAVLGGGGPVGQYQPQFQLV